MAIVQASDERTVNIHYKNWEGKTAWRRIKPSLMWFGTTEFHPTPQWFIKAKDLDKDAERDFAFNDILEIKRG